MDKTMSGQSTLEYMVLITAIVAAILAFASPLKDSLHTTWGTATGKMESTVASW